MPSRAESLKFDRPPVRAVELSLFFVQVPDLNVTSLASLVTDIKADFPVVKERFAQMPWALEESEEQDQSLYAEEGVFPFPWLTFDDGSGHSIGFQDDRFRIKWVFTDGADYPGFEKLEQHLSKHFGSFAAHVADQAGAPLKLSHVRCTYDNELGDVRPLHIALLANGVDAAVASEVASLDRSSQLSESVFHGEFKIPDEVVTAVVELFVADSTDHPGTILRLRSTVKLPEPTVSDNQAILKKAHDNLVNVFDNITTVAQKSEWGVRNE